MPVRIYDIAKKLGVESKVVLARAKELGITTAKVPSSSLDKITAEYLVQEMGGVKPAVPTPITPESPPTPFPAPPAEAPPAVAAAALEPPPVELAKPLEPQAPPETPPPIERAAPVESPPASVMAPPPATVLPPEAPLAEAAPPAPVEPAEPPAAPTESAAPPFTPESLAPAEPPVADQVIAVPPLAEPVVALPADQTSAPEVATTPPPPPPAPPAPPPPPKIGDKVGFIKLPLRPSARVAERATPERPVAGRIQPRVPGRPQPATGRQESPSRPGTAAGRPPGSGTARAESPRPAAPPTPKFVPPTTGELIMLKPPVVVRDLAEKLGRKPFQLIADLMEMGVFANVNQAIDEPIAQRLAAKYGFRFEVEKRERGGGQVHAPPKPVEIDIEDQPQDLKPRAPVVTIMGHVDHGKTTLLDVIRKSNVAAGEAGGITQHIGAYTISIPHPERPKDLQQITFLDTPGHAAFSSMRARGANVTDLVILVVAANDGVMPQTVEALNHARAAKVPILVAVNKCDHPAANPMKVRQQLQDKGLVCEEWGGDTIFVDLSALTKQGVDRLLEMIVLQSEVLELKANPTRRAKGNVIESGLAQGGPTATVLVRKGTLKVSDCVICGQFWGKVRALISEEGKRLKEAGPSVAVKLLGLNGVPEAGLEFSVVETEKMARALSAERLEANRTRDKELRPKVTLENLFDTLAADAAKVLRIVVKADTQGSVEAIVDALRKIDSSKVSLEVVHSAVGTVTESDVILASASKAIVLGFHTRIDNGVAEVAKSEAVQIKLYSIIYELIDEVKEAMAGLLEPVTKEVVLGAAEVRKIFALSKGGNVAGCVISNGRVVRGRMRVLRRKNLVFEGMTMSIRRFQDEVNEVRAGMECGLRLEGFNDYQPGDIIESYTIEKVTQKL
jgi:translation initiation factor IF-2